MAQRGTGNIDIHIRGTRGIQVGDEYPNAAVGQSSRVHLHVSIRRSRIDEVGACFGDVTKQLNPVESRAASLGRGVAQEAVFAHFQPMHAFDTIGKRGGVRIGGVNTIDDGVADGAEIAELRHVQFDSICLAGTNIGIDPVSLDFKPGGQIICRIENVESVVACSDNNALRQNPYWRRRSARRCDPNCALVRHISYALVARRTAPTLIVGSTAFMAAARC